MITLAHSDPRPLCCLSPEAPEVEVARMDSRRTPTSCGAVLPGLSRLL